MDDINCKIDFDTYDYDKDDDDDDDDDVSKLNNKLCGLSLKLQQEGITC